MLIADAQVHVWAPNTPERPWMPGHFTHGGHALGPDKLLAEMDAAGAARAVLVPPGLEGYRNDLVCAAAVKHSDRFVAFGRLDVGAADAKQQVATWLDQPGMRGVRFSFTLPGLREPFAERRLSWLWTALEKAGTPVMALISHDMVGLMDDVAAGHPGLKLTMCHLGLPTGKRDEEAFRDFDRLLVLARRPNVTVKASCLPSYTSDAYPFRRLHPYIRKVYDAFGPERMFWGTDLSRLPCTYAQAITLFTEELPFLSGSDKEWIMGRALCRWIGWDAPFASKGA